MRKMIRGHTLWQQEKEESGWEVLLREIVLRAVTDYRIARKILAKDPENADARYRIRETRQFLTEGWVVRMLDMDWKDIVLRLGKEK